MWDKKEGEEGWKAMVKKEGRKEAKKSENRE